jgi:hypothetical protein
LLLRLLALSLRHHLGLVLLRLLNLLQSLELHDLHLDDLHLQLSSVGVDVHAIHSAGGHPVHGCALDSHLPEDGLLLLLLEAVAYAIGRASGGRLHHPATSVQVEIVVDHVGKLVLVVLEALGIREGGIARDIEGTSGCCCVGNNGRLRGGADAAGAEAGKKRGTIVGGRHVGTLRVQEGLGLGSGAGEMGADWLGYKVLDSKGSGQEDGLDDAGAEENGE